MMRIGKVLFVFGMLAQACVLARAQATPTATASPLTESLAIPDIPGSLSFSVSLSGRKNISGALSTPFSTAISGNAAYLSGSVDKSFSLIYSGGYFGSSGDSASTFHNLAVSQSLLTEHWNFLVSDSVHYLPQTASAGLSGIAGLGDLDLSSLQPDPGQDLLTNYAQRVSNSTTGSASYRLTGRTSLTSSGTYLFQGFIDSPNSIDSNQVMGMGGVSYQLDALNSLNVNYSYSRFSYPSVPLSFIVQQGSIRYMRQWSRKLQTTVMVGPEWIGRSGVTSSSPALSFSASAQLSYNLRNASANISYMRGVLGGSGVIPGTFNDSLSGSLNHRLGRSWNVSWLVRYSQNSSLKQTSTTTFSTKGVVGGAQISRKVTRSLSAYGSYMAQTQSTSGISGGSSVFSGLSHNVSFGLTYSPSLIHLGHQ